MFAVLRCQATRRQRSGVQVGNRLGRRAGQPAEASFPGPSSKNADAPGSAAVSEAEKQELLPPVLQSKNAAGASLDPSLSSELAAALAAGGSLITCGASGNLSWTTTSGSFTVMRQCSMTVPQSGYVFISANGSVARANGPYEAQFEIGIDSTAGDGNIDRWVNVYNDSGDGSDKSVALSVLKNVNAGNHTFYFLGKRYAGSGDVLVYDPTLTVIGPGAPTIQRVYLPMVMKSY